MQHQNVRNRRGVRHGYRDRKVKWRVVRLAGRVRRQFRKQGRILREQLIIARKEAGLSQAEAAEMLGQPQYSISRLETGRRAVEFIELEHLAHIYHKPLSFFATLVRVQAPSHQRIAVTRELSERA